MGNNTQRGIGDALFTSVQQGVLGLLFGQPRREFMSSEIIELVDSGTGATHRTLRKLESSGLVVSRKSGRQKFYQANTKSPIFNEIVSLVRKTIGLVEPLRDALEPLRDRIEHAFVYGSVASGTDTVDSDIDLMIIGDGLDYAAVFECLGLAEAALARPVNPTILTPAQWQKRQQSDSFARRVAKGDQLAIIGGEIVERAAEPGEDRLPQGGAAD